jgi:hypothetical protein
MSTTKKAADLVTVREAIGAGTSMFWLDKLGVRVLEDWRGEPSVTVADARRAVKAAKDDEAANERRQREFNSYLANRDRERAAAGEAAAAKIRPKLLRQQQDEMMASGTTWDSGTITAAGQRLTPASSAALSTIRREALQAWEQKHPARALEDF